MKKKVEVVTQCAGSKAIGMSAASGLAPRGCGFSGAIATL